MQALELLQQRVSVARLAEPAPSAEQREVLYRAAARAPDHGLLRPWRVLEVEGAAREQLGELFAEATLAADPEARPEALDKARRMPLRAPLLLVVIASLREHPKVPEIEQLLTAGCAAHGILLASHAQGLGGIWRTGALAFNAQVAAGLGLAENERIVGFLYLGQREGEPRQAPQVDPASFVSRWSR